MSATILIVDDEAHMRRLLQFALAKSGARLLLAASGAEALQAAKTERIDLVVIDFVMPDLDGFATIQALRRETCCATVPVIMLTARGQTDLRAAATGAGIDTFLTKPFSPQELKREVERLLARTRALPGAGGIGSL